MGDPLQLVNARSIRCLKYQKLLFTREADGLRGTLEVKCPMPNQP